MNCLACRRTLLTQPQSRDPELAAHLDQCAVCARLAERQTRFEQQLDAALRVRVPDNLGERVRFAASMRRRPSWRRIAAVAAAGVLAIGLGLGGWEYQSGQRLAQALTIQIRAVSPDSSPGRAITNPRLARLADQVERYLAATDMGRIVTASEQPVRGQQAAQFVVRHDAEQARIFVLPGAWLAVTHDVEADGVPGKLIPTENGVIAVFCPDRGMLAHVAEDMPRSIAQPS